jgi:hypothetical protein
LFHDSHLPLTKWFAAIALMVESKKGISANQVARHIGCSYKTAWYLCHRIRNAMSETDEPKLGGPGVVVEIDETFIGGKKFRKGVKAGKDAKITVLENTKALSIRPILDARLDPNTERVVTDSHATYTYTIPPEKHETTSHKQELRDDGFITGTRTIESAFSLFKRGIIGSYHKMSRDHIDSYLSEFSWRFDRRHLQPQLFDLALHNLAERKPLTFKRLTQQIF